MSDIPAFVLYIIGGIIIAAFGFLLRTFYKSIIDKVNASNKLLLAELESNKELLKKEIAERKYESHRMDALVEVIFLRNGNEKQFNEALEKRIGKDEFIRRRKNDG